MVSFFCQTMDNYFFNDSTKKVLIQNIQKHPCLYDSSLELYRVKAYRNKAWREVSKQCGCPGQGKYRKFFEKIVNFAQTLLCYFVVLTL